MNNQHEYAPCGKECEYCGADWEPIYGDGTLASPYECGECYSLSAEYQWRGEGRGAGYYDHLERRIADVGAIKSSRAELFLQRLIAAAPDLLEALQIVIEDKAPSYHDCIDDGLAECAWCIARAAIAKATGDNP